MIACIICGGVGEIMLLTAGLGWLLGWLRKRHNRSKCKCCKEHNYKETTDDHKPFKNVIQ